MPASVIRNLNGAMPIRLNMPAAIDWTKGHNYCVYLTSGENTIDFTTPCATGLLVLKVIQPVGGDATISFAQGADSTPPLYNAGGNVQPETGAGKETVYLLWWGSVAFTLFSFGSRDSTVGFLGPTGPTGPAGATGSQGASGSQGVTGAQGPTGAQGVTGAQGSTGSAGPTGPQGATGDVGPTGSTGANGATGSTGNAGATGTAGVTGTNGATGTAGATGATGATGTTGTAGTNGTNGAVGATGATGTAGTNGTNGAVGATGPTGATGSTGTAGTNGTNGSTGATGATGTAGTNGTNGSTGATGATGTAGTNGTNGSNGATGATGPSRGLGTPNAAVQALTAATLTLITGTKIALATGALAVGSRFRFKVGLIKTAAGVATWSVTLRYGVNGTNADAAIATWTSGTNTAAVDQAILDIDVLVTALGASATAAAIAFYCNTLTNATGLGIINAVPGSTAAFNSAAANPFFHVDITSGASAVMSAWGAAEQLA